MFIKFVAHGVYRDALPKGHKRAKTIHAQTMREVHDYLAQLEGLKRQMSIGSFELRVGPSLKRSRSLHPDELSTLTFAPGTTLHLCPHVGGNEITTAMLITALISTAASIGAMVLTNIFFPPSKDDTQEGRDGAIYQGGLITQKENVPLPYIAGLDVACGGNLIEGDVTYLAGGGIQSIGGGSGGGGGLAGYIYSQGYQDIQAQLVSYKGGSSRSMRNSIVTDATLAALIALGDGPCGGIVGDSQTDKERNIYINELPLRDHGTGQLSYEGTAWEERFGDEDQTPIGLVPGVANNVDANVDLPARSVGGGIFWHQVLVTNEKATRARVRLLVKTLLDVDNKKGDQNPTTIAWMVEVKRASDTTWQSAGSFSYRGKSSTPVVLERIINAPAANDANEKWQFRIRRTTPDSTSDKLRNDTAFNGHVELQDVELPYNGTALLGLRLDLSQFEANTYPEIMVRMRGRKVRVPTNYDPITRTYSGTWDGTYKLAATQNPVWHWFHLATDPRQGLGIADSFFSRFELMAISRFNDELVNGRPRYTLNKQFREEMEGWPFLVELAATFRAFPYYNGQQVVLIQDRPQLAPDHYVNNTMVQDGMFDYAAIELDRQINEVLVDFADPKDYFRTKTVRYRDDASIARNKAAGLAAGGVIRQKYEKVGCSSEQEAYDWARMLVFVSQRENETVKFRTLLGAAAYQPGQVIAVDDHTLANKRFHGRVDRVAGSIVHLDQPWVQQAGVAYDAYLVIGNQLVIRSIAVAQSTIEQTVVAIDATGISAETPLGIVERSGVQPRWYRIQDIKDTGEGSYEVTGKLHVEGKHAFVEQNVPVPEIIYTEFDRKPNLPAPTNLRVAHNYRADDMRGSVHTLTLTWDRDNDPAAYLKLYKVQVYKPDGQWHEIYEGGNNSAVLEDALPGRYVWSVTPVNSFGKGGAPASLTYDLAYGQSALALSPPEFVGFD